jgi:hypothetical protein
VVEPFKEVQLFRAMEQLPHLEQVHLRSLPLEGSSLLNGLCGIPTLLSIRLESLHFKTNFSRTLPAGTVRLDLSRSEFSGTSLRSVFAGVLRDDPDRAPMIFQLAQIKFHAGDLVFLRDLDPSAVGEHISEFDWSENSLSREPARYLFTFLATESRLRILTLSNITLSFPEPEFFGMLSQFVHKLPLMGLDLSGDFNGAAFAKFVQSLTGAVQIRRLCLQAPHGGNAAVNALAELITGLPMLTEVTGDCLGGEGWRAVLSIVGSNGRPSRHPRKRSPESRLRGAEIENRSTLH